MKRKRTQTRTRGAKNQPSMMELFNKSDAAGSGGKSKKSKGPIISTNLGPSMHGETPMSKIRSGKPWTDHL